MSKFTIALLTMALLGAGCLSKTPTTSNAPTSVQNQMNGIASSQEVLRAHGLLLVEAKTKGVDPYQVDDWRERGQQTSTLIQEGKYDEATREIEALNAEIRAFLDAME